jgi:ABC-type phosphate/phosphonate transport system permease subunit
MNLKTVLVKELKLNKFCIHKFDNLSIYFANSPQIKLFHCSSIREISLASQSYLSTINLLSSSIFYLGSPLGMTFDTLLHAFSTIVLAALSALYIAFSFDLISS